MRNQNFWQSPKAAVCSLALVVALGGVGYASATHLEHLHDALALKLASPDEGFSQTGFAPVVKKVLPTVVNIASSKVSKVPTEFFGQLPDDPVFRQFFGDDSNRGFGTPRQAPEQREKGLGSGVVMTQDGYILTNNHVVDGASNVTVTLADKREFKAKVIGTDPKSDIAVIKIDATNLPPHDHRRFVQSSGWRLCAGGRRPIRRRPDGHDGDRERHRAVSSWDRRLRRLHSNRRCYQSREFRRSAR